MNDILTIVSISVGIITVFSGFAAMFFKLGGLYTQIDKMGVMVTKTYNVVLEMDDRIQHVENNKADKDTVVELDKRLLKIETQHEMNHGGKQ